MADTPSWCFVVSLTLLHPRSEAYGRLCLWSRMCFIVGCCCCCVQVRQGSVLQQSSGAQLNSVEVTGPILPHCIVGLTRLFAHTTRGNFTATVGGIHDASLAFNCMPSTDTEGLQSQLPTARHEHFLPSDVCHLASLGRKALIELTCADGLYTWTCWCQCYSVGYHVTIAGLLSVAERVTCMFYSPTVLEMICFCFNYCCHWWPSLTLDCNVSPSSAFTIMIKIINFRDCPIAWST